MSTKTVTFTDAEIILEVDGAEARFPVDALEATYEQITPVFQDLYDRGWTYIENGEWVSKSGRLADYPGGTFKGQMSKEDHAKHLEEWQNRPHV